VVEEGEVFGYTSLFTGRATMDVVVEEDLLAYRLPAEVFRRLLGDAAFARHFAAGLGVRLRASLARSRVASLQPDLGQEVDRLVAGPAVWIEGGATVGEAARVMRERRISSVLVRSDPPGIVTDRDFRNRVLAEGLGPDTPVAQVLSRPLRRVASGTPVHAAMAALLDAGVHHLPVERGGEIVGVVTSTDLVRCAAQAPVALLRQIERLPSREAVAGYAGTVARMASALVASGLDEGAVAAFIARLGDALVRRILALAEQDLGPPPAPYAWLAVGSEGRMEQTLFTDQDNALVYADEGAPSRGWFADLAQRANADLERAGFPACPGGLMARTWHATVSEWRARFLEWIDAPSPRALLDAATFFDLRAAAGALSIEPLLDALRAAPDHPAFLRLLARAALDFRPPPPLLLRLRGDASAVDLKRQGLAPVVLLARCYGLEAASRARGTAARLDAAVKAGLLDERVARRATEAHRFLVGLRLRRELDALAAGRRPDPVVPVGELLGVERSGLREAFRAIRGLQEAAIRHYRVQL
jgi:CBS domain-containing protein